MTNKKRFAAQSPRAKSRKSEDSSREKSTSPSGFHARNLHGQGYNFDALKKALPELSAAIVVTPSGRPSIDFSDAASVKLLNQALLKLHYQIDFWDLPDNYLCPAIPGRVDYLHYLADVLTPLNNKNFPKGKKIRALDIGTGANCVYPMLGHRSYGWQFVASDIDPVSVKTASLLVDANKGLKGGIQCRLQKKSTHFFKGIIRDNEHFDVTLCNPPFHASLAEATKGSLRKQKNLALNKQKRNTVGRGAALKRQNDQVSSAKLNFSGQGSELWCQGGELNFLRLMIQESKHYGEQCLWFTSLVSKKENVAPLQAELKKVAVAQSKVIDMWQGNKQTRILAWSFFEPSQQKMWAEHYWR